MAEIELTPDTLKYLATLPAATRQKIYSEIGKQEWEKCAADPMYWIDHTRHTLPYVFTKDEKQLYSCKECADGNSLTFDVRYKHLRLRHGWTEDDLDRLSNYDLDTYFEGLPTTRPFTIFPYIEPIIKTWLREKIVCIEKSRDMMITWLIVTLYTWDTVFHKNRQNIFQSDDSSKACELVNRAYFIWENQPFFLRDIHPAVFSKGSSKSGMLKVPGINSEILGFPQGPEQIRMYHPSGIFLDEAAFQIEAEDAFIACKPAIQAGGRYTMVSSANPGFFHKCCRDIVE